MTGEGATVGIVLIPHRQLGGFCLAVVADQRAIELLWARVTDLSTHDQLDLGVNASRVPWTADWPGALEQKLFAELDRPLAIDVMSRLLRRGVYCSVTVGNKARRTFIGQAPAGYAGRETTSLAAETPLGVAIPVPMDNWRRWA